MDEPTIVSLNRYYLQFLYAYVHGLTFFRYCDCQSGLVFPTITSTNEPCAYSTVSNFPTSKFPSSTGLLGILKWVEQRAETSDEGVLLHILRSRPSLTLRHLYQLPNIPLITPASVSAPHSDVPGKGGLSPCVTRIARNDGRPEGTENYCFCPPDGRVAPFLTHTVSDKAVTDCDYTTIPPAGWSPKIDPNYRPATTKPAPPPLADPTPIPANANVGILVEVVAMNLGMAVGYIYDIEPSQNKVGGGPTDDPCNVPTPQGVAHFTISREYISYPQAGATFDYIDVMSGRFTSHSINNNCVLQIRYGQALFSCDGWAGLQKCAKPAVQKKTCGTKGLTTDIFPLWYCAVREIFWLMIYSTNMRFSSGNNEASQMMVHRPRNSDQFKDTYLSEDLQDSFSISIRHSMTARSQDRMFTRVSVHYARWPF